MPRSSSGSTGSAGALGADRVVGVVALHRVVGERQVARACAPTGPGGRGSPRTESCPRATAGRRSASGRTCRRTRTARGSSRWCRSRARAAPGRRPPRRPSRPTSRRSCASRSCGLRDGAVVDVLAGEVVGVLAHVERADQHGAGRLQPRDQRRVAVRQAARSRLIFEPASVGRPAMSNRFFTANGTPASGPGGSPAAQVRSISCAATRARSSVMAELT